MFPSGAGTDATMTHRRAMWAVKGALAACLLAGLLFPGIPGVEGKGWPERSVGYPVSALIVPLVWHLRGRRVDYPHLADALFVTPFVLDLLGNLVNLFDTVDQFDDILHFANWSFLGAIAIVAWEAVEWVIQEMGTTGLQLTYDDTIGDLVLSTSGGVLGAVLTARALTRREAQDAGTPPGGTPGRT
jgi:hypothetical protein